MSEALENCFVLLRVFEIDHSSGPLEICVRVDLFKSLGTQRCYRARFWVEESFRMTPSFNEAEGGSPDSDEAVLVDWSHQLAADFRQFEASSEEHAANQVLAAVADRIGTIAGNR